MTKRNISLILIGLFLGAAVGGLIGNLMSWLLPEGVVKDFFLSLHRGTRKCITLEDQTGSIGSDVGL